jgi:hypothetical protein
LLELSCKMLLYSGPLRIDDAVVDAMADPAAGHDHMIAKGPFFLPADPQDCLPRPFVERISLELNSDTSPIIERVLKHQVLCLGVYERALPRPGNNRPTDFRAAVKAINVQISCQTDDSSRSAFEGCEGQAGSSFLSFEHGADVLFQVAAHLDRVRHPPPESLIQGELAQRIHMAYRERLKAHALAFERHWLNDHIGSSVLETRRVAICFLRWSFPT